jgi:hypothetical protein
MPPEGGRRAGECRRVRSRADDAILIRSGRETAKFYSR